MCVCDNKNVVSKGQLLETSHLLSPGGWGGIKLRFQATDKHLFLLSHFFGDYTTALIFWKVRTDTL